MRVLLGVGGSDDSIRAFEKTVVRSKAVGDELTVAVVDNPTSDRTVEEITEFVRDTLHTESVDAEVRHLDGDPGSRLVDIAESEGYDVIVLGGGQTSPMGKINIGSIAEFVLLNSHVSVSLIR